MADRYVELRGLPVTQTAANQCVLNLAQASLFNVCEPSKLLIKLRSASFDTTSFEGAGGLVPQYNSVAQNALDPNPCFSGARTGFSLEGPYLRYRIASGSKGNQHNDATKTLGVQSDAVIEYFFDLMGNRMMLLPFQGSIDVITQYPGTFQFEYYVLRSKHAEFLAEHDAEQINTAIRRGSPLEGDATLTMKVAPDNVGLGLTSSRVFNRVPPGAHSLTYNDNALGTAPFPAITVHQEDSAGAKVPGPAGQPLSTLVPLSFYDGALSSYMCRIGHHNPTRLGVTSGAVSATGLVQWHISFV